MVGALPSSMILLFWLDFQTWWYVGWKRKSWFWKNGWTQSSQMPPKWYGRSLGAKGIDIGMVGAKSSSVILVFLLDFVTWWSMGWKTKIMVLENWQDSILTNTSKVKWEKFGSKRNWSWHGWCIAKCMILVFWLDFLTWWCVGWKTKIMVLENWLDSILTNASKVLWEKFRSKRNWSWHGWCKIMFRDFGVFAWFCNLVVWGVKNENHGFGKLVGLNPHKWLQSHVGEVWEQQELILAWLVQSQVPWFWCFGFIMWLGGVWGEKQKSWFWKTG